MKKIISLIITAAFSMSLAGCAAVVGQMPDASSLSGITVITAVKMGNVKQKALVTVILDRRVAAYEILVEKEGCEPVAIVLKKGAGGWIFRDCVFAGLFGIVVDIDSGSAKAFEPSETQADSIEKELGRRLLKEKDILIVKLKEKAQ